MPLRLSATLLLLAGALSGATAAVAGPARPPEQVSRPVETADLDLSTPAGLAAVQARIDAVARRLCRRFEDSRSLSSQVTYVDCVRDTRTAALRQLEQRAPTELAAVPERH